MRTLPATIDASMMLALEQIEFWQNSGVRIADAALSLGRQPPDDWAHMVPLVAAEHVKAIRIIEARSVPRRSRAA